ncbi:MAG TPA: hypothetical protein VFZ53_08465 [Polyangiaceae bacterium]
MTTNGQMDSVGDENAGFSFGFDSPKGVFEVRAWGFWNVDIATAFGVRVVGMLGQQPGAKRLVLDMTALKPMREEGQRSFANVCRALRNVGVTNTTVVTSSQLTKLQLARIVTESGASTTVQWVSGTAENMRNT